MGFTISVRFEAFPGPPFPQVPSLCLALTFVLVFLSTRICQCPKKVAYFTLWIHHPQECDPREAGPAPVFCPVHSGAGWWVIT